MLERIRRLWPWSRDARDLDDLIWEEHVVDEWAASAGAGDGAQAIAYAFYRFACAFRERDDDEMEEALEDTLTLFQRLAPVSRVSHLRGACLTYAALVTFARAPFQQDVPFSFEDVLLQVTSDFPVPQETARIFYGTRDLARKHLDVNLIADRDFYNETLRILQRLNGRTKAEWLQPVAPGSDSFVSDVYADARATVPDPERWPLCMLLERWERWLQANSAATDAARLEVVLDTPLIAYAPAARVRVRVANRGARARNVRVGLRATGVRITPCEPVGQPNADWVLLLPGRQPPGVLLKGESGAAEFIVQTGKRKRISLTIACRYDDREARDKTLSMKSTLILTA